MGGLVDSRELRRFVVRVEDGYGRVLGSGFFAAPGWVVTCAHVVGDRAVATVTPADSTIHVGSSTWRVVARSAPPPPGWSSGFWPYPDMAVLRAGQDVEHPCPLLDARDPASDEECHAWGYARREDGVAPVGSPASFRFEGVEGDGFLRLKAGQAAPGLSGAPLVCPSRRAIVGVTAVTRDSTADLGGWAVPVSALFSGGEQVPVSLAEAGAKIQAANRSAAVRYRRAWNAVLPVGAEGVLDQTWAEFERGPRSTPSSLLRADFGVVPYLFRDAELEESVTWCENADATTPMAIMRVPARGGGGKTRFAIELCKRLEGSGWVTGLWRGDRGVDRVPLPRLVVVDYAEETQSESLLDILDTLARHATAMAPVRVLLLTRTRTRTSGDRDVLAQLDRSAPATLTRVLDHVRDNPVADTPLTRVQRSDLYHEAVRRFTVRWRGDAAATDAAGQVPEPDLDPTRYGLALEVLLEALDQALAPHDGAIRDRPPIERALGHEEKYWRLTAPATQRNDASLLRQCAGLATLAGAPGDSEAHALLSLAAPLSAPGAAGVREKLISWLSSLYDGHSVLNPLRPDRLGEALVARVCAEEPDGGRTLLCAVLGLSSNEQVERCLDVLARLCAYDRAAARAVASALREAHDGLISRAEDQSHGSPERPGRNTLADALQRLLTPAFCGLLDQELAAAEPGNTTYQRDLSISYNKLADLAVAGGRGEDADRWVSLALERRRGLSGAEPGRLDLAEELSYALYFSTRTGTGRFTERESGQEVEHLLAPFDLLGLMTSRASALLAWALEQT